MWRLERIASAPEICHGQPVMRDLRYPGEMLLGLLSSGMTVEEFDDYEDLEHDDLLAALEYGALTIEGVTRCRSRRREVPHLGAIEDASRGSDYVEVTAGALIPHRRRGPADSC